MNEEQTPAGLGSTLYFCPAEEFERLPMQKLEGLRIDMNDLPEREDGDEKPSEGWAATCTGTLESPHAAEGFRRMLRRALFGEGRLPRKEKKRRVNRVLRDTKAVMGIAALMHCNSDQVMNAMASLMFPEQIHKTTDGTYIVTPNPAQIRTVTLCMRRIPRQSVRLYRKHRKELDEWLAKAEARII